MKKYLKKYAISYTVENSEKEFFKDFRPHFDFIYSLVKEYGGMVFNRGLFKIHTFEYVKKWTDLLTLSYFKQELKKQGIEDLICFASNWQGCMYCINSKNNLIIYFDPATCEFFQADNISITSFFDNILVDGEYDIIAEEYFDELCLHFDFENLEYEDSFGHKIYLHLGGDDNVGNYEIVDTEVLWELQVEVSERINEIS